MKARCNPFASDRVLKIRYKLDELEWQDLLSYFAELGFRAAVVGPKGSGKTTLMEDLAERAELLGFKTVMWRQNHRQAQPSRRELQELFAGLGSEHLVCIDSAELLNWYTWLRLRRLSSRVGGMLITVHEEGRLPTLIRCGTTPSLLKSIISELLPEEAQPSEDYVDTLFYRNQGNIRDALRECYFRFADDKALSAFS